MGCLIWIGGVWEVKEGDPVTSSWGFSHGWNPQPATVSFGMRSSSSIHTYTIQCDLIINTSNDVEKQDKKT